MKLLLSVAAAFFFFAANAQPYFTDSTFGSNGRIIKNTSIPYKYITDMVIQADGKTVVLAEAEYNAITRVVLLRYNTNGVLDATFSGNGIADSLLTPGIECYPKAIKLQADGKILVCGTISDDPGQGFVIRYLPNGNPDASFGIGGIFYEPLVTVGNASTTIPTISNLVLLPGGKMVLLASAYEFDYDLILTKLNPNGSIDSTYGINGIVAINASSSFSPEYSKIEAQTDGKLLIGGNFNEYDQSSGLSLNLGIIRLNANGTIDNSYGTSGRVALHTGPADYDLFKDMALQPDGKVVLSGVGNTFSYIYKYALLIRLNTNGTLDANFGTGGSSIVYPGANGAFYSTEGQISLQQDGKILLAGCSGTAVGGYNMAVARLTTAGLPDAGFDGDGLATLAINSYINYAIAVLQQSDGKLVLSGLAGNGNAASTTIARLTPTGGPDATLNAVTAIAFIGSGTDIEAGAGVEIQTDGKILSINGRYTGADYDLSISRYTATGTPDNTWGNNGTALVDFPAGYDNFFSDLLSNGKLMLAAGYSDYFIGAGVLMTRINTNGTTDSSFGINGKLFIKTRNDYFVNVQPQAAFQPDGKIVLLYAQVLADNYTDDSTFVVRLNADGSFDNTFNGVGKKYLSRSSANSNFRQLCLQPDSKIVIAENTISSSTPITYVQRISTNGSTDNTFNNGTPAAIPFDAVSMTMQADGRVLLGSIYAAAARLNSNGTPDAGFGTAGVSDFSAAFPYFYGHSTIKEADSNRIVLVGLAYDPNNYNDHVQLIALKKNGAVDTSFGNAGSIEQTDIPESGQNNSIIAVQADGKILLAGYIETGSTNYSDGILTRLKNGLSTGRLYTFTGSGLWSNPANWSDGTVPPTTIPAGSSVVIDPPTGTECVIDITVHIQTGATVTVRAGKTVRLLGNLIIQ